jgi:hypothetical protein
MDYQQAKRLQVAFQTLTPDIHAKYNIYIYIIYNLFDIVALTRTYWDCDTDKSRD